MLKRLFKILKIAVRCVCILATVAALFVILTNLAVIWSVNDDMLAVEESSEKKADFIIVLGCSVYGNTPSPMLEDRLLKAVELYKAGAAPKILMSGDHEGQYYNEVNTMKNFAVEHGVPSEDIFCDHYGLSTYETMHRAKSIFELNKVIVVTQEYHLSRAVYVAQSFGMEAYGVNCDYRQYTRQFYREIREAAARSKDFLYCMFKPEPKYTGDVIPVTGSGNVTNKRPS